MQPLVVVRERVMSEADDIRWPVSSRRPGGDVARM